VLGLTNREGPDDSGWRWVLSCGAIITVFLELMSRVPRVACSDSTEFALGGYYVLYEDNFESWSPAKAFEEGYTRIDD
jgi:xanthine/CO dehydrogenase XdhC/CoxF family maturation factor